jgi:hypothetical protein
MTTDPSRTNQPARWRDRAADAHALESRAALLVEAAAGEPGIDAEALARIHAAVSSRRRRERASGSPSRALVVRLALAGLVLIASIASARGAVFLWRRYVVPVHVAPSSPGVPAGRTGPIKRQAAASPAPAPAAVEPAPPQTVAPPPAHPPRVVAALAHESVPVAAHAQSVPAESGAVEAPATAPPPHPTVATPEPAAGSSAGSTQVTAPPKFAAAEETEAHLLGQALSLLRQGADPRGALAMLDRYGRLFPHGMLENEALRTRVEAMMALPDARAALALLDGRDSFRGALGSDLLIARAELRANAGRCADALGDFAQVLAGAPARDIEERALFGEAVCLLRLGQDERAQGDIAAYRRRFPHGRFSSELDRLSPSSSGGARHP